MLRGIKDTINSYKSCISSIKANQEIIKNDIATIKKDKSADSLKTNIASYKKHIDEAKKLNKSLEGVYSKGLLGSIFRIIDFFQGEKSAIAKANKQFNILNSKLVKYGLSESSTKSASPIVDIKEASQNAHQSASKELRDLRREFMGNPEMDKTFAKLTNVLDLAQEKGANAEIFEAFEEVFHALKNSTEMHHPLADILEEAASESKISPIVIKKALEKWEGAKKSGHPAEKGEPATLDDLMGMDDAILKVSTRVVEKGREKFTTALNKFIEDNKFRPGQSERLFSRLNQIEKPLNLEDVSEEHLEEFFHSINSSSEEDLKENLALLTQSGSIESSNTLGDIKEMLVNLKAPEATKNGIFQKLREESDPAIKKEMVLNCYNNLVEFQGKPLPKNLDIEELFVKKS